MLQVVLTVREPGQWQRSINTALIPLSTMISRCPYTTVAGMEGTSVSRWSWMLRLACLTLYGRSSQIGKPYNNLITKVTGSF